MDDKLKEALEWGQKIVDARLYNDVVIGRMETLLDAARTAESAEARAIERCRQHLLVISNDLRNDSRLRYHAAILSGSLRSLAPARECAWTTNDPEDYTWQSECGHYWTFDEDVSAPDVAQWEFCPGCGRPIRVEGK